MITLSPEDTESLETLFAGDIVESRLELESWLGGTRLSTFTAKAGSIRWDFTDRRGLLDVDLPAPRLNNSRHPLANLGQVLRASWYWPQIGLRVPCGRWLISEPASTLSGLWSVQADPEGPARLDRLKWWLPGGSTVRGTMATQVAAICQQARIPWTPYGPFEDNGAPVTAGAAGDPLLGSLQQVLDHAGVSMRAARTGNGVVLLRPYSSRKAEWLWTDVNTVSIDPAPDPEEVPNLVTVWYEEDKDGKRVVQGWSEPLRQGPRRWGGPYGEVPLVVKLDAPAPMASVRAQAQRMLREAQEQSGTVSVTMRADPRIEPGDIAQIRSEESETDALCRVTSVQLDVSTGHATVACSVMSGTVAGIPSTYTPDLA